MEETVNEHCPKDCVYRVPFDFASDYCAYLVMEGTRRGCDVSNCNKYKQGKRKVTIEGATLYFRWEQIFDD